MSVADRYLPGWTGDNLYNHGSNWKDGWDLKLLNQKRKEPFNKRFIDLVIERKRAIRAWDRKRVREIDRRLRAAERRKEERAINTLYRNLCKWEIDDKKKDGYTFGIERRKYKKVGKVYNGYLYRQKRINGKKEHIPLRAKSLQDFRENVLWNRAQEQVYGERWVLKDLSPSEIDTFNVIERETRYHKKRDRDPIVERYRSQLGIKCSKKTLGGLRGHRIHTTAKSQPIEERKRILQTARKAIIKQGEVDKKIDEIGIRIRERDGSRNNRDSFIKTLIKETRCRHSTEALKDYIKLQREENPKSIYSILKPNEIGPFAARVMWIHKKLESYY